VDAYVTTNGIGKKYLEIESAKLVGLKRRRAFHLSQCRNYILSKFDFVPFKNTTDQGN
jgi:hypothetical protein